jgi:hypothetical protein
MGSCIIHVPTVDSTVMLTERSPMPLAVVHVISFGMRKKPLSIIWACCKPLIDCPWHLGGQATVGFSSFP